MSAKVNLNETENAMSYSNNPSLNTRSVLIQFGFTKITFTTLWVLTSSKAQVK